MTTAIQEYSATEAALADLRQRYGKVVFDVATTKGMEAARKGRAEIRGYRTALESKRVEIKAPALERCRLIDAEAKRITAELVALEDPIDELIKAEEKRKADERAEKERIERERVASIHARIAKFGEVVASSVGRPSAVIEDAIDSMQGELPAEPYAEFIEQAMQAREVAVTKLREMHAAAVEQEAEQARIKAEREELARLRAEQDAREAEERARVAAQAKADAEARAKIEAEERAARERIEAEERAAKAARDEADRKAREAIEAEERRARAAREEADRIARAQREAEAAKIAAEQERIAAEQREIKRQQAELMDGNDMLQSFVDRFGHRREFKAIAQNIATFLAKVKPAA